jgi:hypothetical protein
MHDQAGGGAMPERRDVFAIHAQEAIFGIGFDVTHRIGAKPSGSQKASRRPWVRHRRPPDFDFIE